MTNPTDASSWAVVLAGGDGTRLHPLTRAVWGHAIPKQYCPMIDGRSLLEMTLDRLRPIFPPARTLVVINDGHREIAQPQLAWLPARNVVSHSLNLDTGPGLTATLVELARRDPGATVSVFPSDHFVRSDEIFRRQVGRLLAVVAAHPERLALLGIRPDRPDPELGYVVPGFALETPRETAAFRVRTFAEKPSAALALRLIAAHDALWNSFVMAFRLNRALDLLRRLRPEEVAGIEGVVARRSTASGPAGFVAPWSFSSGFLAGASRHLAVLRADDFGWSDWGTPETIRRTAASHRLNLPWLTEPEEQASQA